MPSYKLSYFESRGNGEIPRQLLTLSGTPFEDKRYTRDEWPKSKAGTPFGQLPVLEVDGKQIPQSHAIARYLAREFGFAGKTPFEQAWVDALGDQYKDYYAEFWKFASVLLGFAQGDKAKLQKEVGEPAREKFFDMIEKRISSSKSGFLVGDFVTWIDLQIAEHVDVLNNLIPGFLDSFPMTQKHEQKIHAIPRIKEWIHKRPQTPF